ncbi:MAG: beta-glucosidase [Actinomycetota bacterium]|nr:beta-glucosidase [Actinomycetota bacterium]
MATTNPLSDPPRAESPCTDPAQSTADGAPDLPDELRRRLSFLTPAQKVRLLTGQDAWALHAEPDIGLRSIVVSDGPAGVRGTTWDERCPSATVPSPTAVAASWDRDQVFRLGRLLAFECRRKGVDVLLAPTVNLHRTPYGGRHFECFSEDPLLTAAIGVSWVRGLQSEGVGATVKHFVANDSETQRLDYDARIDERPLRELYLAPFESIVGEGGAWAVMASYNRVDGVTMTESPLLREVLKDEWGFDGVVVSDWVATRSTVPSARAALDLAMPGPESPWCRALLLALHRGEVDPQAVDDKVARLLLLAARVGALRGIRPATPPAAAWSEHEISAELRRSAASGIVLLRNESVTVPQNGAAVRGVPIDTRTPADTGAGPLLPLAGGDLRKVAVIGPNTVRLRTLGGGSATVFPPYEVNLPEGLRATLGERTEIVVAEGVRARARVQVADPRLLWLPDGSAPGLEVSFLNEVGQVLAQEVRRSASLRWADRMAEFPSTEVHTVRVDTVMYAQEAGEYTVGVSGVGHFTLLVQGTTAIDGLMELDAELDVVDILSRPPQRTTRIRVEAHQEVPLVVLHRVRSASEHPAVGYLDTMLQINIEKPFGTDDEEIARAAELAADSDVAVVVVGTNDEVESEGYDRRTLALPGRQDDLVRAVAQANPCTVVVVNAGAPVLMPWSEQVPAVLMAWFPGQEGGNALADILLGTTEPGGRLPVSWPADETNLPTTLPVDGVLEYSEGLRVGYRDERRVHAFCFGHGLGYTTWEYRDVRVEPSENVECRDTGGVEVTVRVANTGPRAGREVVQVYACFPDSPVHHPSLRLIGFEPVQATPGQERTVTVRVPARLLQRWDEVAGGWTDERGTIRILAGGSTADLPLRAQIVRG